jgi:hypothetical protein
VTGQAWAKWGARRHVAKRFGTHQAASGAVTPFLLLEDSDLALHVSNVLQVLLLFLIGYWWGRYTDASPWRVGLTILLLGVLICPSRLPWVDEGTRPCP